jgi:hypothetical protein
MIYKIPIERTSATVILAWVVNLTDQIIGIGNMAYSQSLTMVMADIEYAAATNESPDTHLKFLMVKSHCAWTGVHWKISYKNIASDHNAITTMLIFSVHVYRRLIAIRRRNMAMLSLMNIMLATYVVVARVWYCEISGQSWKHKRLASYHESLDFILCKRLLLCLPIP